MVLHSASRRVRHFALFAMVAGALVAATAPLSLCAQVQVQPAGTGLPGIYSIQARQSSPRFQTQATLADTPTQTAAMPQFSVAAGSYSSAQTVSITDSTPGATIYYTTNGTYPGSYSTKYTGPITVSASEIVVAVAMADGYFNSDWGIAEYLITSVPSRFTYTVAGSGAYGTSGDGGPGPVAKMLSPNSAVADDSGNIYIADQGANVVRKVDAKTGIITTIAGTGEAANSGDGGPATSAALWGPAYLLLDGSGHLYIGEVGDVSSGENYLVRKLDLATGQITAFAGNPNGTTNTGPATSIRLPGIIGLATDLTGSIYIGTGDSVIQVNIQTGNASEYVGYGVTPNFQYMMSFAVDMRGNVYGWEASNPEIEKITPAQQVSVVAGKSGGPYPSNGGDGGPATSAAIGYWGQIAVDQMGNLYLSDSSDSSIREVTTNGIINTIAGVYGDPYTAGGDGDPSTSSALSYPGGISVDSSGNLYVVGGYGPQVFKITALIAPPTGAASAPSFSLTPGSYPDAQQLDISSSTPGAAIYLTFDGSDPTTVGPAYHGPLDVTGSAKIKAIAVAPGTLKSAVSTASYTITAPPSSIISTVAGSGKSGFSGSGGPATSARIGVLTSVAVDTAGNAFLADASDNAIWKVDSAGTITLFAGTGAMGSTGDGGAATSATFEFPGGVAVDSTGNVYIADTGSNRIRRIDAVSGIITTVVGGGAWTSSLGDGGPASQASLFQPQAIAFDATGNLYIADTGEGRVRVVDAKTGIITTVAGAGTVYALKDGVPATQQNVRPVGIALDKNGNVFIADIGRIRKIDATTDIITTVAGGGTAWPSDSASIATSVSIVPRGVAVAADGAVYFSDTGAVIRKVDPNTGLLTTVAGNGYYGHSGDGGEATIASLDGPQQLAVDSSGDLFIADWDYAREVKFPAPAAVPQISAPAGAYTAAQHITLTDSTANATIYYTLDGSTPDTGSTAYSGPIILRQSAMLRAAAAAPSHPLSAVASANYTITLQTPTILLTSSAPTVYVSNAVTFTATLAGAAATPTGTVTFLDGSTTLGTATLSNGTGTYTTSSLASGTHTITVAYDGDDNFNSATSLSLTETVQDFTFAAPSSGSTSATVQPGGTATFTLSVTPASGTKTPTDIAFSVSGLPAGATGTFNPATVPAGSGATNVTLSVTVPAQSGAAVRPASGRFPLALAFLALPLLGWRRNRRAIGRMVLLLALAVTSAAAITVLTGCGGGAGSQSTNPQPQTYTLQVKATAGTLTHTTNLTLTVE